MTVHKIKGKGHFAMDGRHARRVCCHINSLAWVFILLNNKFNRKYMKTQTLLNKFKGN